MLFLLGLLAPLPRRAVAEPSSSAHQDCLRRDFVEKLTSSVTEEIRRLSECARKPGADDLGACLGINGMEQAKLYSMMEVRKALRLKCRYATGTVAADTAFRPEQAAGDDRIDTRVRGAHISRIGLTLSLAWPIPLKAASLWTAPRPRRASSPPLST
jgi:hypothetical protein